MAHKAFGDETNLSGGGRVAAAAYQADLPGKVADQLSGLLGDRFLQDTNTLRSHACDWWPISKVWSSHGEPASLPSAVVQPTTAAEVQEILNACTEGHIPLTTSAGRSGVCGQAVPILGGIVLDITRMNRLLDVDDRSLCATVESGVFGHVLEEELNQLGFTLGHFPQSIEISTVGGWIACRSAGQFSTKYGKIEDLVVGLEVELARPPGDGSHISFKPAPASASGPDMRSAFLGSEGVLGVITGATLAISPIPEVRESIALLFNDFGAGLDAIRRAMRDGVRPACLRLYDPSESARHFSTDSGAVMIAICEGSARQVAYELERVREASSVASEGDPTWPEHWFATRNDVSALDTAIERGLVVDTIEIAALWKDVERSYNAVKAAVQDVTGSILVSAHSSHAYTTGACLYFTFAGAAADGASLASKDRYYAEVWRAAMAAATESGSTISHHHGIGIVRLDAYNAFTDRAELDMLRALKRELDPENILNPGKIGAPRETPQMAPNWPPAID